MVVSKRTKQWKRLERKKQLIVLQLSLLSACMNVSESGMGGRGGGRERKGREEERRGVDCWIKVNG